MRLALDNMRPSWLKGRLTAADPLRRHEMLPQIFRYGLVSCLALILDFAVFLSLNILIGATAAGVAGYGLGIILHYLLSRRFVFDVTASAKATHRRFMEFLASGLIGLLVTAAVMAVATGRFGFAPIAAKMLSAVVSFISVFLIRRKFVFA